MFFLQQDNGRIKDKKQVEGCSMDDDLALFITDRRKDVVEVWLEVFSDISSVTITNKSSFLTMEDFDVFLMLGIFAHERYGGGPRLGSRRY